MCFFCKNLKIFSSRIFKPKEHGSTSILDGFGMFWTYPNYSTHQPLDFLGNLIDFDSWQRIFVWYVLKATESSQKGTCSVLWPCFILESIGITTELYQLTGGPWRICHSGPSLRRLHNSRIRRWDHLCCGCVFQNGCFLDRSIFSNTDPCCFNFTHVVWRKMMGYNVFHFLSVLLGCPLVVSWRTWLHTKQHWNTDTKTPERPRDHEFVGAGFFRHFRGQSFGMDQRMKYCIAIHSCNTSLQCLHAYAYSSKCEIRWNTYIIWYNFTDIHRIRIQSVHYAKQHVNNL